MMKDKGNGRKRIKAILCGATIVGIIGVSGIFAYLTDADTKTNKFTVGKVDIELLEDQWTNTEGGDEGFSSKSKDLAANADVPKNPKVKNTGKNPAYVYLVVNVPMAEVITAGEDGTITSNEKKLTELFTYSVDSTKWTEITSSAGEGESEDVESTDDEVSDGDTKITYKTHVYYYTSTLQPNTETDVLFSSVKLVNLIEDQVKPGQTIEMKIDAYAIQSDNLPENKQNATSAYEIYMKQNESKSKE